MRWCATLVACVLAIAAPAFADAPFSFDTAFGRLPKNVRPLAYTIALTPHMATRTLDGTESIRLLVRSSTATIRFNTLNERLAGVRFDGGAVARVVTDNPQQLTTVTLRSAAKPGPHVLAFTYRGRIETGPQGLYVQPYVTPAGAHETFVQTMFESTDARRMFPCWDEPAFRATFTLSVTAPAAWAAVGNMPIANRVVNGTLATTTFGTTPSMPSYLVEYTGGDFAALSAEGGGTHFGVWAISGQEQYGAYALANAQTILSDYDAYFGVPFPLPKLDTIAVPGGFQGAMENWGAIVYNDQTVLLTPASALGDKEAIYQTQAHEMAHQWNGDLVTMGWWDDLWLNESFASWMSEKETDLRNPAWHWWEHEDVDKESAMAADAHLTSHPVAVHITDELQSEDAFDSEITYSKGQSFLRMLEAYLTPGVFRSGVRRYIKARAYSNATAADLWRALGAASGRDVGAIATNWITRPGFPLVSVTTSCDAAGRRTASFTQQRFLLSGTDANATVWDIPLRLRSGLNGRPASVLVTRDGQTAPAGRCGDPLSADADAIGYYRVSYDQPTLTANLHAFGLLPDADRIALLDDQWALAVSGHDALTPFLTAARSMNGDLDGRAWQIITTALETIEYSERGSAGYPTYVTFASSILKPVEGRLGWDPKPGENPGLQRLRQNVLADLGAWGDGETIAEAQRRFARFVADRHTLKPDAQPTVLGIVAAYADAATFDQLAATGRRATDQAEQTRIYTALMGVRDTALAQRALALVLSNALPAQQIPLRVNLVSAAAARHPALAWTALQTHRHAVLDPLGAYAGDYTLAHYLPEIFWDAAPLADIESYVETNTPADLRPDLAHAMETARFERAQNALLKTATDTYLSK